MATKDIRDVLVALEDSEWGMQLLKDCLSEVRDKVRPCKHTVVSFGTEAINTNQLSSDTGKVGIILWIDRDAFKREVNKWTNKS